MMCVGLMIAILGAIIMVYWDNCFLAVAGIVVSIVGIFSSFILSDDCNVYTAIIYDYSELPSIQQKYDVTSIDGFVLTLTDKESD